MNNAVVVTDLPPGITEEKLEIYFQKRKNGGGDVEKVQILENGKRAIVDFEDESTVISILKRNHTLHGKAVKLEKYEESRQNKQFFQKVKAFISPHVLQKLNLDHTDVFSVAKECDNVNIENLGGCYVAVSDSLEKLVDFEQKIKEKSNRSVHRVQSGTTRMDLSPVRRQSPAPHPSRRDRSPIRIPASAPHPSRMDQSPTTKWPRKHESQSPIGSTVPCPKMEAVSAADDGNFLTPEWSNSPFPQPDDGLIFTQNVQTDQGDEVIKAKFCFPEGSIPIPGDIIQYPGYDHVVSLPSTPAGLMICEMLDMAFQRRKLFYVAKDPLGRGFVIQCAYNMLGRETDRCEVNLSRKLVEIKNHLLKDLGIPVPPLKVTGAKRTEIIPETSVLLKSPSEPMNCSPAVPFHQQLPRKVGPFPQPKGLSLNIEFHDKDLAGFSGSGAIHFYFRFPGGEITADDGRKVQYLSYNRCACLPGNAEGRRLYAMLKDAAEQKKLFVVAKKAEDFIIRTKARLLTSDDYPFKGYLEELHAALLKLGIQPPQNLPPLPTKGEAHFNDTPSKEEVDKERCEMLRSGGPFPQPEKEGIVRMENDAGNLRGYENCETIKVYFRFSGGKMEVQGSRSSFQVQYSQMNYTAALPYNDKGKRLAAMLQSAFDEKKLFHVEKREGEPSFRVRPRVTFLTTDDYPKPSYLAELEGQLRSLGVAEACMESVNSLHIHKSTIPQGGALPPGWGDASSGSSTQNMIAPNVRPQAAPRFTSSTISNGARRKTYSGLVKSPSDVESDSKNLRKREGDCGICFSPFLQKRTKTLQCKHVFHHSCINRALQTSDKCPTCNQPTKNMAANAFYSSPFVDVAKPHPSASGWTDISQRSPGTSETSGSSGSSQCDKEEDVCAICLAVLSAQPAKKLSCNHEFHQTCIDMALKTQKKCPYCNQPVSDSGTPHSRGSNLQASSQNHGLHPLGSFGQPPSPNLLFASSAHRNRRLRSNPNGQFGSQPPNGTMTDRIDHRPLPGYEGDSTIVINYHIPGGVQQACHPNPGVPYDPTQREAYLPNTSEAQDLLRLLRRAFEAGLTFRIGRSESSCRDNQIVWNGIPHKTNVRGGRMSYGYPDPKYLFELRQSLASMGIQ